MMKAELPIALLAVFGGITALCFFFYEFWINGTMPSPWYFLGGWCLFSLGIFFYPFNRINYKLKSCIYCGNMTMLRDDDNKPECILCYKKLQNNADSVLK